jgi:hypothetical protein
MRFTQDEMTKAVQLSGRINDEILGSEPFHDRMNALAFKDRSPRRFGNSVCPSGMMSSPYTLAIVYRE